MFRRPSSGRRILLLLVFILLLRWQTTAVANSNCRGWLTIMTTMMMNTIVVHAEATSRIITSSSSCLGGASSSSSRRCSSSFKSARRRQLTTTIRSACFGGWVQASSSSSSSPASLPSLAFHHHQTNNNHNNNNNNHRKSSGCVHPIIRQQQQQQRIIQRRRWPMITIRKEQLLSSSAETTSRFLSSSSSSSLDSSTTSTTTTTTTSSSSNNNNNRWNVGDIVSIPSTLLDSATSSNRKNKNNTNVATTAPTTNNNGGYQPGRIIAYRGSGWYTVQIIDNSSIDPNNSNNNNTDSNNNNNNNSIIKCRGTNLRQLITSKNPNEQQTTLFAPSLDESYLVTRSFSGNNDDNKNNEKNNVDDGIISDSILTKTITEAAETMHSQIIPPPPPPTIHDLDELLRQQQQDDASSTTTTATINDDNTNEYMQQIRYCKESIKRWVVFTDLHCSPATLGTCLDVLDVVHQTAVSQQNQEEGGTCGILFLGDFWHHRQSIRVDCLNAILQKLKTFTVPMIMIPGNHDQISLNHNHGLSGHALTPLQNAYRVTTINNNNKSSITVDTTSSLSLPSSMPGILIFSHPTKLNNALFVPHIRDCAIMESILQSKHSLTSDCIFVHADVTGALMNDHIVSVGGVPPSMFPSNIPIYSGHFHKPHIVKGSKSNVSIEYIGSPYEVSLAEANQSKALQILDSSAGWKCVARIPLDHIGPKHFKISSVQELVALSSSGTYKFKKGDRIVLSMKNKNHPIYDDSTTKDGPNQSLSSLLDEECTKLRKLGVSVEIRETPNSNKDSSNIDPLVGDGILLEDMSPFSLWKSFIQYQKGQQQNDSHNDDDSDQSIALLEKYGSEVLSLLLEGNNDDEDKPENNDELNISDDSARRTALTTSSGTSSTGITTNFDLTSVTVKGFGPFQEAVTYPLSNRGLVLIRGTNKDGGSDSNGVGKTALAMSILWALTGSLDPRPMQDSKVSDVINDSSTVAKVTIKGILNGVDFTISRTKTSSKGGLVLLYDGKDITAQSIKETQELLNEKLGISQQVLARTMFHGQYALNELLEATDTKLKEELSLIVPISIWQEATTYTRKKAREVSNEVTKLEGMITLRSNDLNQLKERLTESEIMFQSKEKAFKHSYVCYENEVNALPRLEIEWTNLNIGSLDADVQHTALKVTTLESKRKALVETRAAEIEAKRMLLNQAGMSIQADQPLDSLHLERNEQMIKEALAKDRIKSLEHTWNMDLSSGILPQVLSLPNECPTCGHPISSITSLGSDQQHSHDHKEPLSESIRRECEVAIANLNKIQAKIRSLDLTISNTEKALYDMQMTMNMAQNDLDGVVAKWTVSLEEIDKDLEQARADYRTVSERLTAATFQIQREAKLQSLNSKINAEKQLLKAVNETVGAVREEVETRESQLREFMDTKQEQARISRLMSDLVEAFGPRGIQTFVLQSTVSVLESATQSYLNQLSDGAQRLQLSLDAGDRITRRAYIRGENGTYKERPLASLSGGQWKRCSLALNLAFADIVACRGRFRPSICIMDEPLTHLDRSGRAEVGRVLRKLLRRQSETADLDDDSSIEHTLGLQVSTILIILQDLAAEELTESFDCIDEVVKENGMSYVTIDDTV